MVSHQHAPIFWHWATSTGLASLELLHVDTHPDMAELRHRAGVEKSKQGQLQRQEQEESDAQSVVSVSTNASADARGDQAEKVGDDDSTDADRDDDDFVELPMVGLCGRQHFEESETRLVSCSRFQEDIERKPPENGLQ